MLYTKFEKKELFSKNFFLKLEKKIICFKAENSVHTEFNPIYIYKILSFYKAYFIK